MSTELEKPVELVNPHTGELVPLNGRTEDLAQLLADTRRVESDLRQMKNIVQQEITNRLDLLATWTLHLPGGLKITGQSPQPSEEWDGAMLREALLRFVDSGELDISAVDAAVETVVTYKPRKAGINALRKRGGEIADTINGLCREADKSRYITVSGT